MGGLVFVYCGGGGITVGGCTVAGVFNWLRLGGFVWLMVAVGIAENAHRQRIDDDAGTPFHHLATRYCTSGDEGASLLRHLAVCPRDPPGLKRHLSESKGRTRTKYHSFGVGKY